MADAVSVAKTVIANEPIILMEDATKDNSPQHFTYCIGAFAKTAATELELCSALIYCASLECGLIPVIPLADEKPEHIINNYSFFKPTCEWYGKQFAVLLAQLRTKPRRPFIKLGFALPQVGQCLELILLKNHFNMLCAILKGPSHLAGNRTSVVYHVDRYVTKNELTTEIVFDNLKEMSLKTKNELILPVRNVLFQQFICNFRGPTPCLIGLPDECVLLLCKYLRKSDLRRLKRTCSRLKRLI